MPNNETTANAAIAQIREIPIQCLDRAVTAELVGALASQMAYSPFANFKAMAQAILHLDNAYLALHETQKVRS